jgi:hypothetical protein
MPRHHGSCSSSSRPHGQAQRSIAFVALQRFPRLSRLLEEARALDASLEFRQFEDLDVAIEWCEARLLNEAATARTEPKSTSRLTSSRRASMPRELELLRERLVPREYAARQMIVKPGSPPTRSFCSCAGKSAC